MFDLKNQLAENHYCSDFDYWGLELDFDDYFDQFGIAVNLDHFTVAVESLYHSDSVSRHYFDYFDFVGLLYRLNVVNLMEEFHQWMIDLSIRFAGFHLKKNFLVILENFVYDYQQELSQYCYYLSILYFTLSFICSFID